MPGKSVAKREPIATKLSVRGHVARQSAHFLESRASGENDEVTMISAEVVRSLFSYDSETGNLHWKVPRQKIRVGDTAGSIKDNGYMSVSINAKKYLNHRVVWLYVYGDWPTSSIDHVNGIKTDNRIENLRLATESLNNANTRRQPPKSGLRGVKSRSSGRWQASIRVKGKLHYLGTFNTPELAFAAYKEAAMKYFGEFVHASVLA